VTADEHGQVSPSSTDEVVELIRGSVDAAAVGAALELGLFWLLEAGPLDAAAVGSALRIQPTRAGHWLDLLASLGLLDRAEAGFVPSPRCRTSILATYDRETWAMLALEARESTGAILDLPDRLRDDPATSGQGRPTSYVDRMVDDAARARRFTRMLYEIHEPMAIEVAEQLDLRGVRRFMDLGGGSGVVALALLRRWPALSVTVVDIDTVCRAGREIAAELGMGARLAFHAADFMRDALPAGFDAVIECDVGVYDVALFAKVRRALVPGGRFLIVDELPSGDAPVDRSRVRWAFEASLINPGFVPPTVASIGAELRRAGFRAPPTTRVIAGSSTLIEAVRGRPGKPDD